MQKSLCAAAGVAALSFFAGSAQASVLATGTFDGTGRTVELFLDGFGEGPGVYGSQPIGDAATWQLTIWSTAPLSDAFVDHIRNFDHFWFSYDGQVDVGLDHAGADEAWNLLTSPAAIVTDHSYTTTLHMPWSWATPELVCCEAGGVLVPGEEVLRWRSLAIYMELNTPGGAGGQYWITLDDRTPPSGAVPEPAAWALMIAGFGLAGATLRRQGVRQHAG